MKIKKMIFVLTVGLFFTLTISEQARATTGSLVTSFDGDGIVTNDFWGAGGQGMDLALDKSGNIVVVGTSDSNLAIARYSNRDGSLDTTFSGDGMTVIPLGNDVYDLFSVAVDADDRILVAGYNTIQRLESDGTPDNTFGSSGAISSAINPVAIAMDPTTGHIIVASCGMTELARYDSSGALVSPFGGTGVVTTGFSSDDCDDSNHIKSLVIGSTGKIYVVNSDGGATFSIQCYQPNGSLDPRFGNAGVVTTDLSSYFFSGSIESVMIELDRNKIVVGGSIETSSNSNSEYFFAAQYSASGVSDSGFDGDGIATTDISGVDRNWAKSVAISKQGHVLLTGKCMAGGDDYLCMTRFNSDGSLDTSFGSGGQVVEANYGGYGGFQAIIERGNILIATTYVGSTSYDPIFAVLKYAGR